MFDFGGGLIGPQPGNPSWRRRAMRVLRQPFPDLPRLRVHPSWVPRFPPVARSFLARPVLPAYVIEIDIVRLRAIYV